MSSIRHALPSRHGIVRWLWVFLVVLLVLQGSKVEGLRIEQGGCPPVANTPYMTIVYGAVMMDGVAAAVGTVVEMRNPRGDVVGCAQLTTAGILPLTPVYGEDATANPPIPGMRDGEKVAFYVDGVRARVVSTWDLVWHDDRTPHEVALSATSPHWRETWSGTGVGLVLISGDDVALRGVSSALSGVVAGVYGESASPVGRGVYGKATKTSGMTAGVRGESVSRAGRGVYGYAGASTGAAFGVMGKSRSGQGRGVAGVSTAGSGAAFGVMGKARSTRGRGVYGYASARSGQTYGVYGESASPRGRGVYGYASATSGTTVGVYGNVRSPDGWAGAFVSTVGNGVYISVPTGKVGLNVARGTKNAVVPTSDGARLLYAEEATEVWFTDYGFGRTEAGQAVVLLDPTFAETVNLAEPYYVFLQPYGEGQVYVSAWDKEKFVVRVRGGGEDVAFGYRIVAKRKGHEGRRLEPAPWADEDPNLNPGIAGRDEQETGIPEEEAEGVGAGSAESDTVGGRGSGGKGADEGEALQGVEATHAHWGAVWSGIGTGLVLTSTTGTGLEGITQASSRVRMGVYGQSAADAGAGVCGLNRASTGVAVGVYGESQSTRGRGVYGYAAAGSGLTVGVYGESASTRGRGVYGEAVASSGVTYGVYGMSRSTSGRGVQGYASASSGTTYGVYGESRSTTGRGVYGYANARSGTTYGVYGEVRSPKGWAARFITTKGNGVYISVPKNKMGLNVVSGSKNAVVATSDGARLLYAEESTEVWFADYGFGRTKGGEAIVALDPIFAQTVNLSRGYHVFVQAYGDADLYVAERGRDHFVVRVRDGESDVRFAYRVVAKRKGHEERRLERAPWADEDPNLRIEDEEPQPEEAWTGADEEIEVEEEIPAEARNALQVQQRGGREAMDGWFGKEGSGLRPERVQAVGAHSHWGEAWSGAGTGLRLVSADDTAMKGISNAGSGEMCGVYGESVSPQGRGVAGVAAATSGMNYGVYGLSRSTAGHGVHGVVKATSGVNYGVYGRSRSTRGRGVYGLASATSGETAGVYGESRSSAGRGVYGLAVVGSRGAFGVMGVSHSTGGIGVYGLASATTGSPTGVYGTVRSPKGWAGKFVTAYGNGVYISVPGKKKGLNVVNGTKNAVVWTEDGARLLYAEESTEVWFADYGFVRVWAGEAEVRIDPIFAETVNLGEAYHVFVQAYGDAEVYVARRERDRFVVRVRAGDPDVLVGYRVVAKRLGHEDRRLERAPWADNDPNLSK